MTEGEPRDLRRVVATKRDGRPVPAEDIEAFVGAYARGEVPDHLAAAFLMAAYIRGLDRDETFALTRAMASSGRTVGLEGLSRPSVDKHSTGGVSDGVTLLFAPLAASMGLAVVKLSGRGLGHTGGTIDKLESIPGLTTDLGPDRLVDQVERIGCAVGSQSADLVPADSALYALREATATIDSVPLIAASVMSKKLAVETDLILLDVKAGSGAFMKTPEAASELADACIAVASRWGRRARAAITDMSQPLGSAVGNALEVAEAVAVLSGAGYGRSRDLSLRFAAEALATLTETSKEEAIRLAEEALSTGRALERFARMVEAQGGDARVADDPWSVLPRAAVIRPIVADRSGFLGSVDAEAIGRAAVTLGAGRMQKDAPVDPSVGIVFRPEVGERIEAGQELGAVHARDAAQASRAERLVLEALEVSGAPAPPPPLVYGWRGTEEG